MSQTQNKFLKMVNMVLTGLDNEIAVWNHIRPMQQMVNQVREGYARISDEIQTKISTNPTSYTVEKDSRFEQLLDKAFRLTKKISAYAKVNKVNALLPLVAYTHSSLHKGTESQWLQRAQTIASEAQKRITELSDYQVTPEEIAELQRTIEICQKLPSERNLVKGKRIIAGQNITISIQTLKQLLDTLDDMVDGMVTSEALQHKYKQWRKISYATKVKSTATSSEPKVLEQ
jgi:hypothetical protein